MRYGYAHHRYERIQRRNLCVKLHRPPWELQGHCTMADRFWWIATQSWRLT